MYSTSARRKASCPARIIFVRHSSLNERTKRSANAFRFGDSGGNRITFGHYALTCTGKITEKKTENGEHLVRLDISVINQDGKVCPAKTDSALAEARNI